MTIPEAQLEVWSHQGSITQSSDTYNMIRNVLLKSTTPFAGKNFSVFLQGSYGNDTNIYTESDVDVIIELHDIFFSDLEALTEEQKNAYHRAYSNATYTYSDFKRDVLKVLTDQYGSAVKAGDKAIAISASGNRRKVDVIVAAQFRRYFRFNGLYDESYVEGICFFDAAYQRIANYPKQHSANLATKHQTTDGWLKPMIRVLKNLRCKLVDVGQIKANIAPSYYLEGLVYNVSNDKFTGSFQESFVGAINWIQNEADKTELLCANEQYYLLRENSHTCWSTKNAESFLNSVIKLWNDW